MKLKILMLLLVMPMIISGCGDTNDIGGVKDIGGSGQCGGVNESGLCVTITSLAPESTKNVDIVRNLDCTADGDTTTTDIETFTDHDALVSLAATLLDTYTSPAAAEFVTFTRYSISYSLSSGYSYTITPPAITTKEYNATFKIDKSTKGSFTLSFIDLQSKGEIQSTYENNGWTGSETPSYTATYTFYGTDDKNRSIEVRGFFTFTIGNFNNC